MKIDNPFKGRVKLFLGKVEEKDGLISAINKKEMVSTTHLSTVGFVGDECADKKHHGGLDRALHHYPEEHYSFWGKQYIADLKEWGAPGMGENISSRGLTEESVYIGDRFHLGESVIEISQPRSPCFKLNKQWGVEKLSSIMQCNSRCGWLYRVLESGNVAPDSELMFISRDSNSLSVKAVCDIFFGDPLNREGLKRLANIKSLSESWRSKVYKRLENNVVEDWSKRLNGISYCP